MYRMVEKNCSLARVTSISITSRQNGILGFLKWTNVCHDTLSVFRKGSLVALGFLQLVLMGVL